MDSIDILLQSEREDDKRSGSADQDNTVQYGPSLTSDATATLAALAPEKRARTREEQR